MILTPQQIGMPARFPTWRPGQDDAIDRITDAFRDYRYVVMCAPVGSGKTATYIAVALLNGWRVLVCTVTKGLQDQLMRDFASIGMVDIRGRGNYQCRLGPAVTCEEGAHMRCPYMGQEACRYRAHYLKALAAPLVTTNYSYDILVHMYGDGLGKFDLVVLDEAHDCGDQICGLMGQTFTAKHVHWMLGKQWPQNPAGGSVQDADFEVWTAWARAMYPLASQQHERLLEEVSLQVGGVSDRLAAQCREWGELTKSLNVVAAAKGPWACDRVEFGGRISYHLEPLWPRQYAASVLFRDAERVLFSSATVGYKTMDYLGLGLQEYDFQVYPYRFPVRRSPIYYREVALVQYDSTPAELGDLIAAIDEFQADRMDRNGIIHSISYKLKELIMERCAFNFTYVTHDRNSESTRNAIEEFKAAREFPPATLVSPSIATGHDFPYREAEYQIIPKVPFIVKYNSNIMQRRCHKRKGGDPEYDIYTAAQTLAQAFGRLMRAEDDRGETIIFDANFGRVYKRLSRHFPAWVLPLIQRVRTLPKPAPSLASERLDRVRAS